MTEPATKINMHPGSRAHRIAGYLGRRKGQKFRCCEIAKKIQQPTQPVARECYRMWTRGQLDRVRVFEGNSKQPTTYYSAKS